MSPMLGAAAMSLSSFCVCMNALRLNLVNLRRGSADDRIDQPLREEKDEEKKTMKKTMNIEGMMCPHCEATVKKALEALEGVSGAEVSHEAGTAVVEMTEEVEDGTLTKAVEEKAYKVLSVER